MQIEVDLKIFLFKPVLNPLTNKWKLARGREGGGFEILDQDFGTEGAAIVLAETLNAEIRDSHKRAVKAALKRLGGSHAD